MTLETNKQNEVFYFCERKHIDQGPEGEGGRVEVLNLVLADRVERSFPVDLELGLAEPWDLHHHVESLQEKNIRRDVDRFPALIRSSKRVEKTKDMICLAPYLWDLPESAEGCHARH